MKKLLVLLLVPFLFYLGCGSGTTEPTNVTVTLNWTATGDDGPFGTAYYHVIKYAEDSLYLHTNFDLADSIVLPNPPQPSGSAEEVIVDLMLDNDKSYYFAIRVADEMLNFSPISNIAFLEVLDDIPPARVEDLTVQ